MTAARPPVPEAGRRRFLLWVAGALATLEGIVLAVPLVGSALGPSLRRLRTAAWSRVIPVARLPVGEPTDVVFTDQASDAYLERGVLRHAWAVHRETGAVVVFSPICPHLGCRFRWNDATRHFECPCHGSVFALDGTVLAGPSLRPLDPLPTEVHDGTLYVRWEQFKSGIAARTQI